MQKYPLTYTKVEIIIFPKPPQTHPVTRVFLSKLGRKLADQCGDDREISFLFQRLSVLIQRYNVILLHDCFVKEEEG